MTAFKSGYRIPGKSGMSRFHPQEPFSHRGGNSSSCAGFSDACMTSPSTCADGRRPRNLDIGGIGAAQPKCGRGLIRVQWFERRPCSTALSKSCDPPGTFHRVRQTNWADLLLGNLTFFRKINGGSGLPNPPSSILLLRNLPQCGHKELAKAISAGAGM
jgi:hypothetical protein